MESYQFSGRPRVKICCICSETEAELAIRCGANALGLVSDMPSGPGVIPEQRIAEIVHSIPPGVTSVLLTRHTTTTDIIAQQKFCGTNALQLCDKLSPTTHEELRLALPGISLIQVIHVSTVSDIEEAIKIAPLVDALLLDTGSRSDTMVELGGTGRTHDWSISHQICKSVKVPVFLAGGLNPGNVADAIRTVHPFAVDVCSGVRTNNQMDENKLAAFFNAVNQGTFS